MTRKSKGRQSGADERAARIHKVIDDCMRRRAEGESICDESVIETYPDLLPELADQLRKLRLIAVARQEADSDTSAENDTTKSFEDRSSSGLHIRCPNCRSPVEITSDAPLAFINCDLCGSPFRVAGDDSESDKASLIMKLGRFELIEKIGSGGFGTVFKAHDVELDRIVAVKMPRRGHLDRKDSERFLREARIAAQLKHPNIAGIHEVGRQDNTVYIICDFVSGVPLYDWMARGLTHRETADLCEKIARALHYAHEHGVIHRDLKPGNIMIDVDGEPHILDFGLAKREVSEITLTLDGQVMGTPAYMSPEQAQGQGHNSDRRSDGYSLGVILFEMLAGELPFRGNERMLIYQVIHDEPPRPSKFSAAIPRDLETICLKAIEKDPDRRYDSAKDFADDLGRWMAGDLITARPIGSGERVWRWCRRNPRVPWFSFTLALVMVIVYMMGAYQFRRTVKNLEKQLTTTGLESASFAARFAASEADRVLQDRFAAVSKAAADPSLISNMREFCADARFASLLESLRDRNLTNDELQSQFQERAEYSRLQKWVTDTYEHDLQEGTKLFSWFVVGPKGVQLAREPQSQSEPNALVPIGKLFDWRAYFRDIKIDMDRKDYPPLLKGDHIKDIKLSPVFRTIVTEEWVVAVSVPVYDESRTFLGIVGLMIRLGDFIELEDPGHNRNMFPVLFDTREGNEGVIVDHPLLDQQFSRGRIPNKHQQIRVPLDELENQSSNYCDPMDEYMTVQTNRQRWLRSEKVPISLLGEPCGLYLFVQESYSEMVDNTVQEVRRRVIMLSLASVGLVVVFLVPLWALVLRMLK